MNSHKTSLQFPVICGLAAFLGLAVTACSPSPGKTAAPGPVPAPAPVDPAILADGQRIFNEVCAQCHLAGEGVPSLNPPLIGSAVLKDRPEAAIRNVLKGSQGKTIVNGQKFTGIMAPLDYLSDDEVAAIVTYVRKRFTDTPDPLVTPKQVAAQR